MPDSPAPKLYLFHDFRHIRCGDLEWHSPDGALLPLIRPPEPPVKARARPVCMSRGIRLAAQKASKGDPLPAHVRLGRVIFEEGTYRSWYLSVQYPPGEDMGCYSKASALAASICSVESKNGLDWSPPVASPIHVGEQTAMDGFTVFHDPGAPPAERYKGVYMAIPVRAKFPALWRQFERIHPRYRDQRLRPDFLSCLYGAVSPDGVRWRAIRKPLMIHKSDTDTTLYYDADLRKYVMYTRLYRQERRWVGRAETDDFRHWEGVEPLLWPDLDGPMTDDIYTNCRTTYPGLPGYHLMFPMIYHRQDQTSSVRMYSSADGICWSQVPGGPVVTRGGRGEWDAAFISVGNDLVPWKDDRIALVYRGSAYPHKYPRWRSVLDAGRTGWVYWPKGRLSAVVADKDGEFFTFPIIPAGRTLRLNVRVPRAGEVRVGLAGVRGRSVAECEPIFGDHLSAPVRWKGNGELGTKGRTPVTLHFRLRRAELFSFEFA